MKSDEEHKMQPTLKPCPFCGGEADSGSYGGYSGRVEQVGCGDCGIYAEGYLETDCVKAWNQRAHGTCKTCEHSYDEANSCGNTDIQVYHVDPDFYCKEWKERKHE